MVKSRAEICRDYRKRLKEKDNEGYLKKERERRRKSYIPSSALSDTERKKRNKRNLLTLQIHRHKKRQAKAQEQQQLDHQEQQQVDGSTDETSGYESVDAGSNILRVALPFPNRRRGSQARKRNEISRLKQQVAQLKTESSTLRRRLGTEQRRNQRLNKRLDSNVKGLGKLRLTTKHVVRKDETQPRDCMEIHHCDEKTSEQEVESKESDRAITKEQSPSKLDDREDKTVEMTPRSKAEAVMQKAKLDEQQKSVVRKDLILSGLFSSQLKAKKQNQSKQVVKSTYSLISSAIIKKYRLAKEVCSRTGLNKNTMSRYMRESKESKLEKAKDRFARKYEEKVLTFLERDDNSRSQPGKADKRKNENGETKQTRVLTDYLENLHMKYLSENPESSVSLATFCRIRPKHLLRCEFITRNSCLCIKHQNMSLTLKLLHNEGICTCTNPESFVKEEFSVASAEEKLKDNISWPQWKRVAIKDKDVTKSVTRVVTSVVEKGTFLKEVVKQREEFQEHVERMTAQYEQIRYLKQNLPAQHVLVHMDFAENYSCKSLDEVQTAYWNQTSVTLHPIVCYFRNGTDLEHQSYVIVSDTASHNSAAVLTFLDAMMPDMKSLVTDLSTVHYWTDSPTSQYRNKSMFDFVANHKSLYNCHAIWNYFEAGHGKGPCDGLGGTVKRMADIAMKSGKVVIQDATDFYSWAVQSSISNVKFKYVSDADINAKSESLKATCDTLKTVTGTMRVHAVVGIGNSQIRVRETSCCCLVCIHDINTCGKWSDPRPTRKVNIPVAQTQSPETQAADPNAFPTTPSTSSTVVFDTQTDDCECNPADCPKSPYLSISVNDFVAAVYDKNWYIGKVTDLDDDDDEVEISFMEFKKKTFQWPSIKDKLWLGRSAILCKIDAPAATGKSKRNKMFLISESDKAMVKSCFDTRL